MKVNEGQWRSMMVHANEMMPMMPVFLKPLKKGCFGLVGWPSSTKVDQEVSSRARQTLETSTGRATGPPERWSPKVRWKMEVCCTRGGHHFDKWSEMIGCIWYGYIRPLILRSPGEGMTLTGGRVENDRRVLEGFALLGDVYIYIIYIWFFRQVEAPQRNRAYFLLMGNSQCGKSSTFLYLPTTDSYCQWTFQGWQFVAWIAE